MQLEMAPEWGKTKACFIVNDRHRYEMRSQHIDRVNIYRNARIGGRGGCVIFLEADL